MIKWNRLSIDNQIIMISSFMNKYLLFSIKFRQNSIVIFEMRSQTHNKITFVDAWLNQATISF